MSTETSTPVGGQQLDLRTVLVVMKADTREFVTIEVCDTTEELDAAWAGIRDGYTAEPFLLTERPGEGQQ
jgi:hypothetical protein